MELINTLGNDLAQTLLYYLNMSKMKNLIEEGKKKLGFQKVDILRYIFQLFAFFGWGYLSDFDISLKSKSGSFTLDNMPKLNSKSEIIFKGLKIHYEIAGIAAKSIKNLTGEEIFVEETQCVYDGAENCKFEIIKDDPRIIGKKKSLKSIDLLEDNEQYSKEIEIDSNFIKFLDNIAMPKNGELVIGPDKERILFIEILSLNSMLNSISSVIGRKGLGAIMYRMGKESASKNYLRCNKIEEIKRLLFGLGFAGWGIFKIINYDQIDANEQNNEPILIRVKNSIFTVGLPKTDYPTCYITAGTLHAIFENICEDKKKIIVRETKCASKGDEFCEFIIRPLQ
ncbi:MAG: hypothetical protein GY870_05665 [archaeon]|nr:hypothetical protein [archaeon]